MTFAQLEALHMTNRDAREIRMHPHDFKAYVDMINNPSTPNMSRLVRFDADGNEIKIPFVQPAPPATGYSYNGCPILLDDTIPAGSPVLR